MDWRWSVVGVVAAIQIGHTLWIAATPGGENLQPWVGNGLIDTGHLIATLAVLAVAVRFRGSRVGLGWALVSLGLLFGQFGESSWSFQELVLKREVPFPSVSDIGYAGAYFPVFVGLLLMPVSPVEGTRRLRLVLDALILMSALALISWSLIIGELLAQTNATALAQGLSVFYPLADLGIIFAVFVLVARTGPSRVGFALALLGAGYFAAAFSDSLYIYLAEAGYEAGDLIDIGWVASNSLITLAALHRLGPPTWVPRQAMPQEAHPAFWPSLLPYLPVVPLSVLLVLDVDGGDPSMLLAAGVLVVIGLVILRQVLSIYEDVRLNRELASLSALLEVKVKEKTMEMLRRGRSQETLAPGERPNGADEPVGGLGPFHQG